MAVPVMASGQAGMVTGDAVAQSLTGSAGDAARGRAIIVDRQKGFCLLCHSGPFNEEPLQGNLAPSLAGAGSRWTEGQLRLRLMDNKRINPESIMPAYHRIEGLNRVGPVWRDKPILTAAEIEDVLAFLIGLQGERAP
ncbi:MAG: sulfur oxidation c-type cytochrome SoxX [Roseomonas sp.]|nr:sulfur oxidation c-type cytochrome SoxX [Roseomonas sp.]MCA3327515.1 sulfur oxidation c-type cytochrome SoxX [Roseomonas sp.]MCA3331300.1 sulfur oxidation c-type cytochrome SoxX [Roseomonas sp.]MCA3335948.1 sulfur oxidation c-type cytochrome SoxX [Roseomonas sp.]MCA3347919.1 sulfur oxidation c-type cytochrome SoxX [Roseomonas sp.]